MLGLSWSFDIGTGRGDPFPVKLEGTLITTRNRSNLFQSDLFLGVLFIHDLSADPWEAYWSMGVAILGLVVLGKPGVTSAFGANAAGVEAF